jgi:hypothetical protein
LLLAARRNGLRASIELQQRLFDRAICMSAVRNRRRNSALTSAWAQRGGNSALARRWKNESGATRHEYQSIAEDGKGGATGDNENEHE